MEAELIDGDLLEQDVDAIVNAWNRNIIPWWLLVAPGRHWPERRATRHERSGDNQRMI